MTSSVFAVVPTSSISIERDERQRREIDDLEGLMQSIQTVGLINPIIITRDHILIAGERRLTAFRELGLPEITVQYVEDLSSLELYTIELEENIKRKALAWQDEVRAVERLFNMKQAEDPKWSQQKTADALGISRQTVTNYLAVAEHLASPEVSTAQKLSVAVNFVRRKNERSQSAALREVNDMLTPAVSPPIPGPDGFDDSDTIPESAFTPHMRHADILTGSFLDWSANIQEVPFNLIHCDFPYGVNAGDKIGQSSAKHLGGYADTADIYFELLSTFTKNQDNFCSPSAHMIFWMSMKYYDRTIAILKEAEWRVDPFPLIWHRSDNAGILPDPNRGPRRTYETALFCTRGDRKVVRPVANSVASATTKEYHMSEKPKAVLTHFMRMLVDTSTRVLDPTCGGGNAIAIAEELGASYSLGIEMNPDYADRARDNLKL